MRKKKEKFAINDVLKKLPVGIAVFDEDYNIILSNSSFRDLLKNKAKDKEFIQSLFNIKNGEKRGYFEYGDKIIGYTPYDIGNHKVILLKDMTESIYTLNLQKNREINDVINYIFSMVRHEIGNPINTIKVSLSVLENQIETASKEKIKEFISRLQDETDRLKKILDSLKEFSKYGVVKIERTNLDKILMDTYEKMNPLARSKHIMLFLGEIAPVEVEVDSVALSQVLSNLIKNSIEALENKEGEKLIQIYSSVDEKFVRIHIIDNGPGIPEDAQEKLFMPFFTTKKTGTGMGLAISKGLITAMNGWIGLVNTGNGTMAVVTLPRAV
ncbi:MAG: HAMP domain-containing histidine kinase [Candidatus Aminicenantes bacterium]|nr:HAMP domain-containing histidine kinase [Candidatus Aminicenantes bacterium]